MNANQRWRLKNPDKVLAHSRINEAKQSGKLIPQNCEICGTTSKLHAHHDDYSKPLEVRWLCTSCHRKLHAIMQGQNLRTPGIKKSVFKPHHKHYQPAPKRDELLEKANQLRANGYSYRQIANTLNITKGTAYKWLNNTLYK